MDNLNFRNKKDNHYNDELYNKSYIDIKEFREKGYLQELNRLFLHKLGLALEVGSNGNEDIILGIIDIRNEGSFFDINDSSKERIKSFKDKETFIKSEFKRIEKIRGFSTEEIPK